ncbi:MAG: hypothetical protein E5X05_01480 [Mesorhizobium sp.]|nr:MAG: hypothetical protein E5X05_01480 [Mesorhizobium sp.]
MSKPTEPLTRRQIEGAAAPSETPEERNMRMGWGCACHGQTFCPNLRFSHYEDDVPVFDKRR